MATEQNNRERDQQLGYLAGKLEDLTAYVKGHMDREEERFVRMEKYIFRLYALVGVLFVLSFLQSLGIPTSQFFMAAAKAAIGMVM